MAEIIKMVEIVGKIADKIIFNLLIILIIFLSNCNKINKYQNDKFYKQNYELKITQEKTLYYSSLFLGKNYKNNILTEKHLYDFENFNCLTYVITVLAMNYSQNIKDFEQNIAYYNYYDSKINDIQYRRHFFWYDFVLQFKDKIKNITHDIIDKNLILNRKIKIDKKKWFKKIYNLDYDYKCCDSFNVEYISNKKFLLKKNKFDKLLDGIYIVTFIPNNKKFNKIKNIINSDIDILHLGFLIKKNNKLIFRHASLEEKKVLDINFIDYLLLKKEIFDGFSIFAIL